MNPWPDIALPPVEKILEGRTLIVGEVNTGKTTLTGRLLEQAADQVDPARIGVVDLAPEVPETLARKIGQQGVGGKLIPPSADILYLSDRIDPPRLSTDTEEEAAGVARKNADKIEGLFEAFARSGRDILFINDISLYLQAGQADSLIRRLKSIQSVTANGYYGAKLGQGRLSQWERREMEALMTFFDRIIRSGSEGAAAKD